MDTKPHQIVTAPGAGASPHPTSPSAADEDHQLDFELPAPPKFSGAKIGMSVGAVIAVVVVAFGVTYASKREKTTALNSSTSEISSQHIHVDVVMPKVTQSDRALTLPGSIEPMAETTLYPQANGYVRRFVVDIGDSVKKDQMLAEIDTPELDQQIQQADAMLLQVQAQVLQAKANQGLAQTDLTRYKALTPSGVTSESELDQKRAQAEVGDANLSVANAAVGAQQANIRRLSQLKSFARVVAPFDGKVTARWAEKGALVTTGNATPLFRVAAIDPARVFIQVPQDVVPSIKAEIPAMISIREYPTKEFAGKISRSSGQLDSASRTMRTEVRVPNPNGELVPGMFANIALTLPAPHKVLEVPSTAVISDARGVFAAIVNPDNTIHIVPVVIERDTGPTIEVSTGLREGDRIAKIASSQLIEGMTVDVSVAPVASGPAAPPPAPSGSSAHR